VSAVTLTVNTALALAIWLSVTVRVKVELVAPQSAPTLAVTLPNASTLMPVTLTPDPVKGVDVTVNVSSA
jgi:hypothetical protein